MSGIPSNQIGISTNIFENPLELSKLIEKFATDGFKVIEIEFDKECKSFLNTDSDQTKIMINSLLTLKNRYALTYSIHGPYLGLQTDIANCDESVRAEAVRYMKKALDLTHELGATTFTCHPGYLGVDREKSTSLMESLQLSLDELVPYAENQGIDICLENTGNERPRYIVLDDDENSHLCQNHGVSLTLDLIHYTTFKKIDRDYFLGLKEMLPITKNIHIADMKMPEHFHLPLGEGDFPYEQVLAFVFENGYKHNIIVEETVKRYSADVYTSRAVEFKQYLQEKEQQVEIA